MVQAIFALDVILRPIAPLILLAMLLAVLAIVFLSLAIYGSEAYSQRLRNDENRRRLQTSKRSQGLRKDMTPKEVIAYAKKIARDNH